MNQKYFLDTIKDETLAKMIDTTLRFEKNQKAKQSKIYLFKIIPAVAVILLVIGFVNIVSYAPKFEIGNNSNKPEGNLYIDMPDKSDLQQSECYTFLIIGRDNAGLNTDTIMFINFNIKENKMAIMNIPRDTYIKTESYTGKINGVLAHGYMEAYREKKDHSESLGEGICYLEKMIEYTFGVPVNRHIMVDLKGFKDLVDQIGGIDMEVPQDMKYSDPHQNLYIDLKHGWQHLDGDKAEQLVRFRSGYEDADIGRIKTQQKFIAALAKKLFAFDLNNIKSLFEFGSDYMTTNLNGADFAWFAAKMLTLQFEDIRVHTVPGQGQWIGNLATYEIYKKEIIEIINKYYNPFEQNIPETDFNIYDKDIANYNSDNINIDGIILGNLIEE